MWAEIKHQISQCSQHILNETKLIIKLYTVWIQFCLKIYTYILTYLSIVAYKIIDNGYFCALAKYPNFVLFMYAIVISNKSN